jgi:hypothetical protein
MKKFWKPSLLMFLALSQVAALCDDDLAEIPVDHWYESQVTIDEDESTPETEYVHNDLIDLASDPEVAKHKDKFKDVTIAEIWLEVSNVTGSNISASGKFSFVSSTGTVDLGDYSNLAIAEGGKIEIIPDQAVLDLVEQTLLANDKATIISTISLSGAPVKFDVKARYHVIAKASL